MVDPDIMYQKEYYQLRQIVPETKKIIDAYIDYNDIKMETDENILNLQGHQQFINNLFNPTTPYKRLLLNHGTGTGKSLVINTLAAKFISYFKRMKQQPQVTIIGFTEKIIIRDLIKFPSLGYIKKAEIDELIELSRSKLDRDILRKRGLRAAVTRRIVNKTQGGYYKFYGYQSFAQELIQITSLGNENNIQYSYIYETEENLDNRIKELTAKKYVVLNRTLLNSLKYGFIACDEAHLLYSSQGKNSRGMAIKYAIDYLETEDPKTAPRIMYVTATPLTGSPTEIVPLMELLIPKSKFSVSEFFTDKHKFKSDALEKIQNICRGYVSFLKDTDLKVYPKRIMEGTEVPQISYLKFIKCPMSLFQEKTLKSYKIKDPDFSTLLASDTITLYDIAFPNPNTESGIGLYQSSEIIKYITTAPEKWKQEVGIDIVDGIASGPFLQKNNIEKYSNKYSHMLNEILEMLIQGVSGKILIYHYFVSSGGLLLIRNLLLENGILDKTSSPVSTTVCSICGVMLKKHPSKSNKFVKDHAFRPCRLLLMYGELSDAELENSLFTFNDPNNIDGYEYRIMLGSRAINEGYDFKEIRYLFIMSLPKDISTMIQVFGRAIRRYSHIRLPPDQRFVKISIFVSTFYRANKNIEPVTLSPELLNYARKMKIFLQIQEIEKVIREYAIDNFINYHKMESILDKPSLDGLSFKPAIEFKPDKIKIPDYLNNYYIYGYVQNEIKELIVIIKKLFSHRPIWLYEDLVVEIKDPKIIFDVSYDHKTFADSSILMAMNFMLQGSDIILDTITNITHNTEIPYIILDNEVRNVVYIKPYYILVPVDNLGIPLVDYNQWFIPNVTELGTNISLTKFWKKVLSKEEIVKDVTAMLNEYKDDYYMSLIEVDLKVHNYIAEEIIEHISKGHPVQSKYKPLEKVYKDVEFLLYAKDFINKDIAVGYKISSKAYTSSVPIGYINGSMSYIYHYKEFEEVSSNLFFTDDRPENNKIIGFFKSKGKGYDFLLRKPIEQLEMYMDRRKIKSGASCNTYTAHMRAKFAHMLGLTTTYTEDICYDIKRKLLNLEIKNRNATNGLRWLYLPFDTRIYI